MVAPLVGAWIEILKAVSASGGAEVAPLVGAWIEIVNALQANFENLVAPLVGAWIEMQIVNHKTVNDGRSPRGSVD